MRLVNWKDKKGFVRRAIVKDDAKDKDAQYGVPSGPPELSQLDWEQIELEVNNALAKHNLWTWDDVQKDPNGVGVALSIFKRHLIALYREEWNKPKPTHE